MNYRETLELLREAHRDPIDDAVYAAVRGRIRAELQPRRHWAWLWSAAVAAAVAAAVVGAGVEQRLRVAELPAVALEVPGAPEQPRAPAAAPRRVAKRAAAHAQEVLVKIETNDPDVVIYWIAETKGEDAR